MIETTPPRAPTLPVALSPSTVTIDIPADVGDSDAHHTAPLAAWSGAPIRAIVPLPRRCALAVVHANHTTLGTDKARLLWVDPDSDTTDSDAEDGHGGPADDRDGEAEAEAEALGRDADTGVRRRSRYCAYQSITAAEGLAAWSFEELRAECYAQSLVARGTRPPPAARHALVIPPAFTPRVVARV